MSKNIIVKVDDVLARKFEEKIKNSNKDRLGNKLNKSSIMRKMILDYINNNY